MKVGLYLATQFTPDTPLGPQVENLVEQVRVARANGFESLWAAQHFITAPMQMFQTMPLLARLLPEADGMQVGPNILVFPALNPVLVAEEAATMDWLSDGRYVLGLGLGLGPGLGFGSPPRHTSGWTRGRTGSYVTALTMRARSGVGPGHNGTIRTRPGQRPDTAAPAPAMNAVRHGCPSADR